MQFFRWLVVIGLLVVAADCNAQITQTGAGKVASTAVSPTGFLLINTGSVMLISTVPSKFKIQ